MNRKNIVPILVAATIAIILSFATEIPDAIRLLFVYPSAAVASVFSGVALVTDGNDPMLLHRFITVIVVPECSGYSFWMILFSLNLWQVMKFCSAKNLCIRISILLALSWMTAVVANGLRISASIYITVFTHAFLPESFVSGIHEWTGFLVFFPILCLSYILVQKRLNHENRQSC